jgi:hypothetical protein
MRYAQGTKGRFYREFAISEVKSRLVKEPFMEGYAGKTSNVGRKREGGRAKINRISPADQP